MRTRPFKKVFDRVVRLLGRNRNKDIPPDMAEAIVEAINERVSLICQVWRWPEWELTEERAFRQVWHADAQYLRQSVTDGNPDEVFYIPDTTYYAVNPDAAGDPPVGTLPTDTDYFQRLDPVGTFVAYDQTCKRAIGIVRGTFARNPRVQVGGNHGDLRYRPSERGVDVLNPSGPTVFLTYSMPVPQFTMTPYVVGRAYPKGTIVFDPNIGECFQALALTGALPDNFFFWRRVPFPDSWVRYTVWGAFADCLSELDSIVQDAEVKMALMQNANIKADTYLQSAVDTLTTQGQVFHWNFCKKTQSGWCESQPWSGGTVSTLTDQCEDELGWVYPVPTITPQVTWQYHPEIESLRTTPPTLDQVPTRLLLPGSLFEIVIIESGIRTYMKWELLSGAADPSDPNGQVEPLDFDPATNFKFWSRLA